MKDIKGERLYIIKDKNNKPIPVLRRRVIQANKYSSYYNEKVAQVQAKQKEAKDA